MDIFRSMLHGFLPFSLVSLTELCSFWYGVISSLCTSWQTKLSLTGKTDDVKSGRRHVDWHGRLQAAQG